MNSNSFDITKLMNMLSTVDKKDLEASISKASQILNSKDTNALINEFQKKNK